MQKESKVKAKNWHEYNNSDNTFNTQKYWDPNKKTALLLRKIKIKIDNVFTKEEERKRKEEVKSDDDRNRQTMQSELHCFHSKKLLKHGGIKLKLKLLNMPQHS